MSFTFKKAIWDNDIVTVKKMIDEGFDVNNHGITAINSVMDSYLCDCCETNRLHKQKDPLAGLEIAKLLLKHGAHPDGRGSSLINTIDTVVSHGFIELFQLLVQHGIKLSEHPYLLFNAHTIPMAELLIKNGIDINQRWNDGSTVLIRTIVQTDDLEYITFLLNSSDLYAVNNNNETAFHIASVWSDLEFVTYLVNNYYDVHRCNTIKKLVDDDNENQAADIKAYLKKELSNI